MTYPIVSRVIEDGGVVRSFDDQNLSVAATKIVERVGVTHQVWSDLSVAMSVFFNESSGRELSFKENTVVSAYLGAKSKINHPVWSTSMSHQDVEARVFAMQMVQRRASTLMPERFGLLGPKSS